jgi:Luciferase-like monooxygenase
MEAGAMRYGILNFSDGRTFELLAERWRRFEALGFDSAWIADDLVVAGSTDFEPWVLLAGLARETRRMRIGTLVTTVRLRHPTFLAAQVLTLDHASGGRAAVGIGAGEPYQNATIGKPPWSARETLERLDEQAGVLYADVWNCIGGQPYRHGPNPDRTTALRTLPEAVAETERLMARLDDACAEVGRDPATLARSILALNPAIDPLESVDAFDTFVGAYAQLGIEEITFYWPPVASISAELPSPEEEARFERVAAQRILTRPAAAPKEA